MIRIERLRLRLPAAHQHRAVSIARKLGDMLAQEAVSADVALDAISLPPQHLTGQHSDEDIARHIARQIGAAYCGGQ